MPTKSHSEYYKWDDLVKQTFDPNIFTKENLKITIAFLQEVIKGELSYCNGDTYPEDLEKDILNNVKVLKQTVKQLKEYKKFK